MTPEQTLVYEALRFAIWAAGEGLIPIDGEPARSPEDFIYEFAAATGFDDWDNLPDSIIQRVSAQKTAHSGG